MSRVPHWLGNNYKSESPSRLIIYDCETKSEYVDDTTVAAKLDFGWACSLRRHRGKWSKGEWFRFTTGKELFDWVETKCSKKTKVWMFAHNQQFDITVTKAFYNLRESGWTMGSPVIECPPFFIQFRKDSKSLLLIDSLNYFSTSLADLAPHVGMEKWWLPDESASKEHKDAYCINDVEILVKALTSWIDFVRDEDLGNFQKTLSGTAMAAYKHRFKKHSIFIHNNLEALSLERLSYMGARTEAYSIGKQKGTHYLLDINSQYPSIMASERLPRLLRWVARNNKVEDIEEILPDECAVATVLIDLDTPLFPKRTGERLIFPVGRFMTTLAWPELYRAYKMGVIHKIFSMACYKTDYLFTDYVNYFYNMRQEAKAADDSVKSQLSKLLLNCLYGKWSQRSVEYVTVGESDNDEVRAWLEWDVDSQSAISLRQFNGIIEEKVPRGESRDSLPIIASHVTSAGRLMLYDYMVAAGEGNTLYVDTDSLIVNTEGRKRLDKFIDPNVLGMLKEEWVTNDLEIHCPKDYRHDDITRIKGIRKNAEVLGNGKFIQDKFLGLKGMIQRGSMDEVLITRQKKTLSRKITKGQLTKGKVDPFRLWETG